jgi:hypothetical protein
MCFLGRLDQASTLGRAACSCNASIATIALAVGAFSDAYGAPPQPAPTKVGVLAVKAVKACFSDRVRANGFVTRQPRFLRRRACGLFPSAARAH